jgi:predicted enzyme related to lactoylglutathione lyase
MAAKKKVTQKKTPSRKKKENFVVWFEIPVVDIKRAMKFYSKVFGIKMECDEMGDSKGAMFPFAKGTASGALIQSKENKPSRNGTMIYLNGGSNLSIPLKRVVPAGGKIILEKYEIGENGSMAIFEDTEGNHVALHSSH